MLPWPIRQRSAKIVRENIDSETKINTDESKLYNKARMDVLPPSRRVKHTAGEYVRGDVTTNTVESYFSIFKRGMRGTYQHCSRKAPAPLSGRI